MLQVIVTMLCVYRCVYVMYVHMGSESHVSLCVYTYVYRKVRIHVRRTCVNTGGSTFHVRLSTGTSGSVSGRPTP